MKKSAILIIGLLAIALVAWFLGFVFSGNLILRQVFHLGPLTIRFYGIFIAAAAMAGFYLAMRRAKIFGIPEKAAEDLLFWVIIGGFIGARIYHVLSSATYYWAHPIDAFKVWNGGLSIYGAVLGGILAVWFYKRLFTFNFSLSTLLDWLVPSVAFGQIIGRFGNLFNYEAFGYPTNLPWKMFVPVEFRPEIFTTSNFFHPWFLYEILGNLIVLILLLKLGKPNAPGKVAMTYILLYNLLRFCLEFLRIDSTFIGSFRLNAAVSMLLVIVAAGGLLYRRYHVQTS